MTNYLYRLFTAALLAFFAASGPVQAQYRVADPKYGCTGSGTDAQSGVLVSRMIMTPDNKALCDYGFSPGDNMQTSSMSQFLVDLVNRVIQLESKVANLESDAAKREADLVTWKSKTLNDAIDKINTLPFATQASVVDALTPLLADSLRSNEPFLEAVGKAVKAK